MTEKYVYMPCPDCDGSGKVLDLDAMNKLRDCNVEGHSYDGDWDSEPPQCYCVTCGKKMPEGCKEPWADKS